jgi:hypothetical protein
MCRSYVAGDRKIGVQDGVVWILSNAVGIFVCAVRASLVAGVDFAMRAGVGRRGEIPSLGSE